MWTRMMVNKQNFEIRAFLILYVATVTKWKLAVDQLLKWLLMIRPTERGGEQGILPQGPQPFFQKGSPMRF